MENEKISLSIFYFPRFQFSLLIIKLVGKEIFSDKSVRR